MSIFVRKLDNYSLSNVTANVNEYSLSHKSSALLRIKTLKLLRFPFGRTKTFLHHNDLNSSLVELVLRSGYYSKIDVCFYYVIFSSDKITFSVKHF